jgi:hypothetical protein
VTHLGLSAPVDGRHSQKIRLAKILCVDIIQRASKSLFHQVFAAATMAPKKKKKKDETAEDEDP